MPYQLEFQQPDLIILDIMLPGDDGFTLCRKIRFHIKAHAETAGCSLEIALPLLAAVAKPQ